MIGKTSYTPTVLSIPPWHLSKVAILAVAKKMGPVAILRNIELLRYHKLIDLEKILSYMCLSYYTMSSYLRNHFIPNIFVSLVLSINRR